VSTTSFDDFAEEEEDGIERSKVIPMERGVSLSLERSGTLSSIFWVSGSSPRRLSKMGKGSGVLNEEFMIFLEGNSCRVSGDEGHGIVQNFYVLV